MEEVVDAWFDRLPGPNSNRPEPLSDRQITRCESRRPQSDAKHNRQGSHKGRRTTRHEGKPRQKGIRQGRPILLKGERKTRNAWKQSGKYRPKGESK